MPVFFMIVFKENRSDQIDPERNNVKWWVHAIAGSRQCEQSIQVFQASSDGGKYLNNGNSNNRTSNKMTMTMGLQGMQGKRRRWRGVFDGVNRRYL